MNGIQLTQNKFTKNNNSCTKIRIARIVATECTLKYMRIVISTEDHY